MALGATRAGVVTDVLRRTLVLTGIGVVIGLATASAVTRTLSTFLYAVSPTDPMTFVGVGLLLLAVAATASYLPARRATRVSPTIALRAE